MLSKIKKKGEDSREDALLPESHHGFFGKSPRCYPPIGIYQLPRLVCTKRLIYYIPIGELCLYFDGNVGRQKEVCHRNAD
ncbi:hypothetical protein EZS27_001590 [termite gut metagenome]|uniref:Uncharacterized protein n=1 Tax=termite gut metagenome TaxID=433724 RepID=A0A5J4SYD9_9ZZZZ